jgi:hypothetical protein
MSSQYWATLVGIFGTTISPYLFFWQAAQEVEEERKEGLVTVKQRQGATGAELRQSRNDVVTGMFFSNLIMYFIILPSRNAPRAWKDHHHNRQGRGGSIAPPRREWRVLAFQPGFDRGGDAGGAGSRRIQCVCGCRGGGVARVAR